MYEHIVYFLERSKDKAIKIGHSVPFGGRIAGIKGQERCDITVLGTISINRKSLYDRTAYHIEQALHVKFHKYRIEGEWFRPNRKIIEYIEKYTSDRRNYTYTYNKRITKPKPFPEPHKVYESVYKKNHQLFKKLQLNIKIWE